MDRYFAYFVNDLGGRPATPDQVYALLGGERTRDIAEPDRGMSHA